MIRKIFILVFLTLITGYSSFAQKSAPPTDTTENVLFDPTEMPSFTDKEDAIYDFIGKNLKYPPLAKENGVMGKVMLRFIVEKDGTISNFKILGSLGFGCDEEAIRLIKSMPKWNPGKMNGKPVRAYYTLPIYFNL
jgi:periplasmic protein TonB